MKALSVGLISVHDAPAIRTAVDRPLRRDARDPEGGGRPAQRPSWEAAVACLCWWRVVGGTP